MTRDEVAFELRADLSAAREARAKLDQLRGLDPDAMAAVKTIVSLLLTRAMREDDGGLFAVRVGVGPKQTDGLVGSSHGWASLEDAPKDRSGNGLAVLDAYASTWRVDGDSVCFSVASNGSPAPPG